VRRHKDKIRHHKAREGLSEMSVHEHVLESDGENGAAHAANEQAVAAQKAKITKTDTYVTQALHVDEAVMQLDLLHQNFLVFKNPDTGLINVVYRREDGNYGLIETQPPS
jgi:putative sigma-54 modulation protein